MQAVAKYPSNSLRTSALLELANQLAILGHRMEAIAYYQQAMENIEEVDSSLKLRSLTALFKLFIESGKVARQLIYLNI